MKPTKKSGFSTVLEGCVPPLMIFAFIIAIPLQLMLISGSGMPGIIIVMISFGLITAVIANRKGRSFGLWWCYGAIGFLVALPHSISLDTNAIAISKRKENSENAEQRRKQEAERVELRRKLQQDITAKTGGKCLPVIAIGGNGWEFLTNKKLSAGLNAEGLYLWDMEALKSYTVPSKTITEIDVGGPGTVRSGGGAMGGGFGLDGFLVGAAAATVLNILTSHKTTKTLVHVKSEKSEIFLLISTMEPDETRIYLSPLFVSLKPKSKSGATGIAEEIEKLAKLLADGHITNEEYSNLKSRLF